MCIIVIIIDLNDVSESNGPFLICPYTGQFKKGQNK